jgi:hypothetical protein
MHLQIRKKKTRRDIKQSKANQRTASRQKKKKNKQTNEQTNDNHKYLILNSFSQT